MNPHRDSLRTSPHLLIRRGITGFRVHDKRAEAVPPFFCEATL